MQKLPGSIKLAALAAFGLVFLLPAAAFAQTGTLPPASLTQGTATAIGLTLLIGTLTTMVQSGSVFGLATTPRTWLPGLTVMLTFLTGVYGFVSSLNGAFVFDVTDIVYAFAAGFGGLFTGAIPHAARAATRMAHADGPAKIYAASKAATKAIMVLGLLALGVSQQACITSTPTVPQTPANAAQITQCQSTSGIHNTSVIGGIVLGGVATTAGTVAAADNSDKNLQTGMAITAAATAGVAAISAGIAGMTAAAFANDHCSDVVSNPPLKPAPSAEKVSAKLLPSFSEMAKASK